MSIETIIVQKRKRKILKPVFDKSRDLSWSAISSFRYDKEEWWNKYCLHGKCIRGNEEKGTIAFCVVTNFFNEDCPLVQTSKEQIFGKTFGKLVEEGKCDIPEIKKYFVNKKEYKFKVKVRGINLIGFADDFCDKSFLILNELKTGKHPWTQKKVDNHDQITMYNLMNYYQNNIKPEDVLNMLFWIPTEDWLDNTVRFKKPITVHPFSTKRTERQVLDFADHIVKTFEEMNKYALNHE